jgi:hypothetical protein
MNRRTLLPWAVLAICLVVYACLVAHQARGGHAPVLCLFRVVTGQPCSTCGATRATLALASGEVGAAFRLNPLIAGAWLLSPLAVAAFAWRRRTPPLGHQTQGWLRRVGFSLLLVALAANWAYVLRHLPELEQTAGTASSRAVGAPEAAPGGR